MGACGAKLLESYGIFLKIHAIKGKTNLLGAHEMVFNTGAGRPFLAGWLS